MYDEYTITRAKTGATLASLKRVGAIWHWRIGRLGGSVYLARRRVAKQIAVAAPSPAPWLRSDGGNGYRRRIADAITSGRRVAFL